MILEALAAGGTAAPQNRFGFVEALQTGGFISYAVVTVLAIMSFGSFFILFTKWWDQAKIMKQSNMLGTSFWRAGTLEEGTGKLDRNSAWRQLADDTIVARDQHLKMAQSTDQHDWMVGSLMRSEALVNSRLASGLPFLATVGATAPFVGLFGTVVGIYRALIAIGIAGSASIDKVAGPVGEALIMTALGLLVAVPAVLAYNYLQARNKRIAERLTGFSTDLLANVNSGGAIRPRIIQAAQTKASPAKPITPASPKP